MPPSAQPTRLQHLLVPCLLLLGSWIGLHAALPGTSVGILWPPAGLALAFVLWWGPAIYRNLALSSVAASALVVLLTDPAGISRQPLRAAGLLLLTSLHTFLGPLVAASLVRRHGTPGPLGFRGAVSRFVWGGLVGQWASALAGIGTLWLCGQVGTAEVPRDLVVWWMANVTSVGLLTTGLSALREGDLPLGGLCRGRPLGWFAGVAVATGLSFFLPGVLGLPDIHLELLASFPVLMSAFSLGISGAAMAALLCTAATLAGTLLGYGAFARAPSFTSLLSLQAYMLTIMGASLSLGDTRWRWKQAQADLETSVAWFRELFHGVRDAVVVLVPDETGGLVIERANASARKLLGLTGERRPLADLPLATGPLLPGRQAETLARLGTGQVIRETWQLPDPGDGAPWIEGTLQPADLGGRRCLLAVLQDVTDRKAAEAEGERLRSQLLQAQKLEAVGLMTAGIAHDFNNLLAAIQGYGDLLACDPTLELEEVSVRLRKIAARGHEFTQALLAFSRPGKSERTLVDLNLAVSEALPLLRRLVGSTLDVTFRPSEGTALLEANPGQLDQVLVNLVANARDATPNGGSIELSVDLPGEGWVALRVRDTGAGMDEATQARIFEAFFTTKAPGRGTGLGLATVADIVKHHHGTVQVSSAPGTGTTFTLRFPKRG